MEWNDRLVSVIVLCYQNEFQLQPTLESIIKQDYARIEIIISDDGSDEFDINKWKIWCSSNGNKNIENVRVLRRPINQGTVKNLRNALHEIRGDYYMILFPGDCLYETSSISMLMMCAALNKHRELLIMGKAVDSDSSYCLRNEILSDDDYNMLKTRNAKTLFQRLISGCCITEISSLHRRDFPELVDGYDTDYRYYEDYPTYIRMSRKGITPLFIDKIITLHLVGENGSDRIDTRVKGIDDDYFSDRELIYQKEIKPYLHGQPLNVVAELAVQHEELRSQHISNLMRETGKRQRFFMIFKHPGRLFFYQQKGILLIERLFRISIWSLLFLSLLKSSHLLSGVLDLIIECVLLSFSLIGIMASLIHRFIWIANDVRRIWIRTLAGTK